MVGKLDRDSPSGDGGIEEYREDKYWVGLWDFSLWLGIKSSVHLGAHGLHNGVGFFLFCIILTYRSTAKTLGNRIKLI